MTTKCLDNKICTFKILLSWRFPRKTAVWTIFLSVPQGPPQKAKILFLLSSRRLWQQPPRRNDYQKLRWEFYSVSAAWLLPEILVRAPKIIPVWLEFVSVRAPFPVGAPFHGEGKEGLLIDSLEMYARFSGKSPENTAKIKVHVGKYCCSRNYCRISSFRARNLYLQ